MDYIFIRELVINTCIGVYAAEKQIPQPIQLDLQIALPDQQACLSDDIAQALDYAAVVEQIRQLFAEHHFELLEAAAEQTAALVRQEFAAPWVSVSIAKLQAIAGCRQVGVCLERGTRPPAAGVVQD